MSSVYSMLARRKIWMAAMGLVLVSGCADEGGVDSLTIPTTDLSSAQSRVVVSDSILATPVAARVSPSGDVWILDSQPPHLTVRSEAGVVQFGAVGEGPEEIGFATALVASSDSSVMIVDGKRRQLREFFVDESNTVVESPQLSFDRVAVEEVRRPFGDPLRAREGSQGTVWIAQYPAGFFNQNGHWSGVLMNFTPGSSAVRHELDMSQWRTGREDLIGSYRALLPIPLWDVCPSGDIALYVPFADSTYLLSGASLEVVSARRAAIGATTPLKEEERIEAAMAYMQTIIAGRGIAADEAERLMRSRQMEAVREISPYRVLATDLRCGVDGALWFRTTDLRGYPVDTWLRVGETGELTRYEFPPDIVPFHFTSDGAFAFAKDSVDRTAVRWISLE